MSDNERKKNFQDDIRNEKDHRQKLQKKKHLLDFDDYHRQLIDKDMEISKSKEEKSKIEFREDFPVLRQF